MLTIFGLLIILVLIFFLLTDRMSPMVSLIIIPCVGITLYWLVSGFMGTTVVERNFISFTSDKHIEQFLHSISKENNIEINKDQLPLFKEKAFSSIKIAKNAKLDKVKINQEKIITFYESGTKSLGESLKYDEAIKNIINSYGLLDSLKDHAKEISGYYDNGIKKVMQIAIMFIFAILFFGVLNDVGLFKPAIDFIVKLTRGNVISVCIGTAIIAMIAHLDGSGATTFLIVIPPLIPVYKRLNMNPYLLFLIVAASAGLVNMLPWGGPLGRIASVLGVDTVSIYHPLIKVQLVGIVCIIAMTIILGLRENKRLKNPAIVEANKKLYSSEIVEDKETGINSTNKFMVINIIIALATLVVLISGYAPSGFVFMVALCVVLLVNYKTTKERMQRIAAHASGAISMGTILLAAGIYIGILDSSGMLKSIAKDLSSVLPEALLPHLHIVMGIFGVPFELLLDTNGHYYSLYPVVAEIVKMHGVSGEIAGYTIMIGSIVGTFVSPFSPALWLGLGLAKLSMGKHIAYSFFWLWGLSLVIMFFAYLMGVF